MRFMKIVLRIVIITGLVAGLDYTLPARDIVKIVGTEVVRTNVDSDSVAFQAAGNVDVRFINSVRPNEHPRVYRNEDTGWGWPPYFKFSSGDLQADAQRLTENDQWVAVTHYGWRMTLLSSYPNAIRITPVDGPDVTLIPWPRIVAVVCLLLFGFIAWRLLVRLQLWATDKFDRLRSRF